MTRWQRLLAISSLSFGLLIGATADAGQGLVAGIYPGAVRDKHAGDITVRVYLTRAPFKRVCGWYARKVGDMTDKGADSLGFAGKNSGNVGRTVGEVDADVEMVRQGHVVMDQSTVVRSLKDMTATRDVGVVCEGLRRKPTQKQAVGSPDNSQQAQSSGAEDAKAQAMMEQLQQMQAKLNDANQKMLAQTSPEDRKIAAMSDLFDGLRDEAMAGLNGHTKQDLLNLYAKYKHLETDWFPTVNTAKGSESYDRWLLERDRAELKAQAQAGGAPARADASNMQALSARIQAAAAAGRMDEVQRLSMQMRHGMAGAQADVSSARQTAVKDQWTFWLDFLKDLDAHAYRTRIWVNTQPSSWGY